MTYYVQVTVGSGKPSASQANKAELLMSAVALTSDCLARMVGRTEKKKVVQEVMSACSKCIENLTWYYEEAP